MLRVCVTSSRDAQWIGPRDWGNSGKEMSNDRNTKFVPKKEEEEEKKIRCKQQYMKYKQDITVQQ